LQLINLYVQKIIQGLPRAVCAEWQKQLPHLAAPTATIGAINRHSWLHQPWQLVTAWLSADYSNRKQIVYHSL